MSIHMFVRCGPAAPEFAQLPPMPKASDATLVAVRARREHRSSNDLLEASG